jgi:hypothetical protein
MRSFRCLASNSPDAMAASIIRTEMPKALAAEPRLRSNRRVLSLSGRGLLLDPTLRPAPSRLPPHAFAILIAPLKESKHSDEPLPFTLVEINAGREASGSCMYAIPSPYLKPSQTINVIK